MDVATTFGVPLTSIGDLDMLIKDIDAGKHEKLLSGMINDKRQAVMDALVAIIPMDTGINVNAIPCKISHVDEATIVYLVSIQPMANSYVGDAGVSILDPSKPKENFQFLPSENICDGVQFSIPRKIVETVSTQFDSTLYGYLIGKCVAFPVAEYYVCNNGGKFGLTKIMMNSKGFFFFKFRTTKG
ncbi:hypothetical protein Tco_0867852 [Tanacetum coccineum]